MNKIIILEAKLRDIVLSSVKKNLLISKYLLKI